MNAPPAYFLERPDGALRHALAIDTMCFLYRFESNPTFGPSAGTLFDLISRGQIAGEASVLVRTEALIWPMRQRNEEVLAAWRLVFSSFPNLRLHPIDSAVADLAAELRARHNLRTPDALHVATAVVVRADAFVTGDDRLKRVTEIEILVLPRSSEAPSTT